MSPVLNEDGSQNIKHIVSKGVQVCACREERPVSAFATPHMDVVPVLFEGGMWEVIHFGLDTLVLDDLQKWGSRAAPDFMDPEGIMVYHVRAGQMFKYTLEGDGAKG